MTSDHDGFLNNGPAAFVTKMQKGILWGGVVMILLGVAAIAAPLLSSLVVELMIGWLLTVSGALAVIGAFSLRRTGVFAWNIGAGLVTLIGGVLMLSYPLEGLVALTVLVALILLITGLAQAIIALWIRPALGWAWAGFSALISIALGLYIFAALPEASAVVLGLMVGIDFVSTGTAMVLIARSAALVQHNLRGE
ncbi:HdeD family acid-resistance protein [Yoonia sp. I 8.24]|uniref:HdeD family acid-resistance protein n=1 Tax=Yoonia sp. I 8.24 TaxID=1537229 RepID=UPI001EE10754|nr:DUF308 domain-containing protein [Yoonia sp. I 8.24]MCG3268532.1 DUF308 domain-containing protein [Yoonia sp. I 8.24]